MYLSDYQPIVTEIQLDYEGKYIPNLLNHYFIFRHTDITGAG